MSEPEKQNEVIDAEFEESTTERKSEVRGVGAAAFAREASEVVEVIAKPVKRISPETARKMSELADGARTLGQHIDGAVDAGKRVVQHVKDGSEKVRKVVEAVRPSPVIVRKL
jgi:hypothetical protein